MAKRLTSAILLSLVTSTLFAACDDGDDRVDPMVGGEAGEAGKNTAGSSSGGTSAGRGGTQAGGGEMQGGEGPGAAGDAGMAGEGGDTSVGGAPLGGNGGTEGGAAGMSGAGGAEGPTVDYACGDTSIARRLCSALTAADCHNLPACVGEPPPDPCCTDCVTQSCPDCVAQAIFEREPFEECPACLAEYDRFLLCAIEPFEAGNVSAGVMCIDMYGPIVSFDCEEILNSASQCSGYLVENDCPATWPLE